ncbi:hypothetical protein [Streptomyces sp. NPDC060194]|uniref:hypothetical protein n=1 Tax=Streptomyces sp. NPDC060194 TaxID=3347069 RepID=UPI00366344CA
MLGAGAAVLGAGSLLVPAALAPVPAAVPLGLAAALLGWHLLLTRAGGTVPGGPVAAAGRWGGPRLERALHAVYFGGFACGQAAVAAAAGEFAADGAAARWTALAVLAAGALGALAGTRPPPLLLRLRLGLVLLLCAAWASGWLALDRPPPGTAAALLPLLFCWVGLEATAPAPGPSRGATLRGALYAVLPCALLLTALLARTPPRADTPPLLGAAAAVVLTTYCLTNLASAGARWPAVRGTARTGPAASRPGVAVASATALALLAAATAGDWSVGTLLLAPGAATAVVYGALGWAAVRHGRPSERSDGPPRARPTAPVPGRDV